MKRCLLVPKKAKALSSARNNFEQIRVDVEHFVDGWAEHVLSLCPPNPSQIVSCDEMLFSYSEKSAQMTMRRVLVSTTNSRPQQQHDARGFLNGSVIYFARADGTTPLAIVCIKAGKPKDGDAVHEIDLSLPLPEQDRFKQLFGSRLDKIGDKRPLFFFTVSRSGFVSSQHFAQALDKFADLMVLNHGGDNGVCNKRFYIFMDNASFHGSPLQSVVMLARNFCVWPLPHNTTQVFQPNDHLTFAHVKNNYLSNLARHVNDSALSATALDKSALLVLALEAMATVPPSTVRRSFGETLGPLLNIKKKSDVAPAKQALLAKVEQMPPAAKHDRLGVQDVAIAAANMLAKREASAEESVSSFNSSLTSAKSVSLRSDALLSPFELATQVGATVADNERKKVAATQKSAERDAAALRKQFAICRAPQCGARRIATSRVATTAIVDDKWLLCDRHCKQPFLLCSTHAANAVLVRDIYLHKLLECHGVNDIEYDEDGDHDKSDCVICVKPASDAWVACNGARCGVKWHIKCIPGAIAQVAARAEPRAFVCSSACAKSVGAAPPRHAAEEKIAELQRKVDDAKAAARRSDALAVDMRITNSGTARRRRSEETKQRKQATALLDFVTTHKLNVDDVMRAAKAEERKRKARPSSGPTASQSASTTSTMDGVMCDGSESDDGGDMCGDDGDVNLDAIHTRRAGKRKVKKKRRMGDSDED